MVTVLLPIGGMEAACRAQEISQAQAAGQIDVQPGQRSFTASPVLSPPQVQSAAAPVSRRGQFTLNFDDADVYTIIQTVFGEVLKVNYVVDPRVKGRVTFRTIAPVPAENVLPLMEVILRLNGIGIVEDNSLYRIVPISDISKEPSPISYGRDAEKIQTTGKALLQVVPIIYVPSSEALKLIAPFASNNAVLVNVPKGNQIIIVDTDANVKRLLKLVEVFDNDRLKQQKPQVFVYQVQNSKAKDIATILQQIFTGGKGIGTMDRPPAPSASASSKAGVETLAASMQPTPGVAVSSPSQTSIISIGGEMLVSDFTKIISDDITNIIAILSTPEDYATIIKVIEQIDIVPRQVIIEGMIASVSLTDNLSLGLAALFKGSVSGIGSGRVHLFGHRRRRNCQSPAHRLGCGIESQGAGGAPYPRLRQQGGENPGRAAGSPPHFGNLRRRRRFSPAELSIQRYRHYSEGETPDQRGRLGFA
jgi:type II secretory pathway component GspD/PulD (secretin)